MWHHLFKNWPVYVGLGGFTWLVIALIKSSREVERKEEEQKKAQGSKEIPSKK